MVQSKTGTNQKMKEIKLLSEGIIKNNVASFERGLLLNEDGRKSWARYASFDYCFNYFQGFKNKEDLIKKETIQNSCLHLAFYLASWGMLRGSSFLLQKSIKFYEPLIEYISKLDDEFWKIDVSDYSEENIERLIRCGNEVKRIIGENNKNKVSDTLITKIMLGVFGNVPAFDNYFKNGSNLNTFNSQSLKEIKRFYKSNNYSKIISNEARKLKAFNYDSGRADGRSYTEAKIIDMIFFIEGYKMEIKKASMKKVIDFLKLKNLFFGSPLHGIKHWQTVENNGLKICEKNKADKEVVSLFAYLHDSGRKNEDEDNGHGQRAVGIIDELVKSKIIENLSEKQLEQLKYACRYHDVGTAESDDITIQTCWDSDRLDLPRVGIEVNPEMLFTREAKDLITHNGFGM